MGKTPADDGFVAGAGEDEVGVFGGGGDGCYPVAVAAEGASEGESFGHGDKRRVCVMGGPAALLKTCRVQQ